MDLLFGSAQRAGTDAVARMLAEKHSAQGSLGEVLYMRRYVLAWRVLSMNSWLRCLPPPLSIANPRGPKYPKQGVLGSKHNINFPYIEVRVLDHIGTWGMTAFPSEPVLEKKGRVRAQPISLSPSLRTNWPLKGFLVHTLK